MCSYWLMIVKRVAMLAHGPVSNEWCSNAHSGGYAHGERRTGRCPFTLLNQTLLSDLRTDLHIHQIPLLFTHLSTHSFKHQFTRVFARPFKHLFAHPSICTFIYTFVYTFIYARVHIFIYTSICASIYTFIYRLIYALICTFLCTLI